MHYFLSSAARAISSHMGTPTNSTREQLLDAAEKLFLQHGLDDVSARAIVREAGQKNQSALQYHFGGREGLITSIINRRMQQLESRRSVLIEHQLSEDNDPPLRTLCAVLVRAPFLLCRERKNFREFLGQLGQRFLASDRDSTFAVNDSNLPSLQAIRELIWPHLAQVPPELLLLRAENANYLVLLTISRRARLGGSFRGRSAELFFNNLVDQMAAMLATPISPETQSLLDATH
jgi:AcrR family transcriptional regulator